MRIFHIKATDCTLEMEHRFTDLVSALSDLGISQHVLMNPDDYLETRLKERNVPFHTQKFNGMFDLRSQQAAQQIAESFGPHIIQMHSPESATMATKIKHNSLRMGFAHDNENKNSKNPSSSGLVLSIGYMRQEEPLDYNSLPVMPLVYNTGTDKTIISRSDFDTPDDKPLIGTMVDLIPQYDLEIIFQALRDISGSHFWVIGKGEHKKSFEHSARKQAVHDKVRFIEEYHNWPRLLEALDLCVVPQKKIGTDRLTLEAWSCGVCVLSGASANHSPVTHGQDGRLVAGNNRLKWHEEITNILADKKLRQNMAQAGQEKYKDSYTPDRVVGRYLQSYETALKIKF